ncbi:MAG: hypothetical protein J6C48_04680 [Paludibacteraceae bacterium]|nr:hypothetical protein [Paludibacteraceae bacterium]
MKKLFSILVLALSCSALFAQQTTVALLNHEGTLTSFYGANALADAHKAAVHGDVITLSGGSFAGLTFSKAVTVRGAGMVADSTGNREITYINSDVRIEIPTTTETPIIFEGIFFQAGIGYSRANSSLCNNSTFNKCRIHGVNGISDVMGNANFYNCLLGIKGTYGTSSFGTNINIVNSIINSLDNTNSSYCKLNVTNCVVTYHPWIYNIYNVDSKPIDSENTTFKNCIFTGVLLEQYDSESPTFYLPETAVANNCISCYYGYKTETSSEAAVYYRDIFSNIANPNSTNVYFDDVTKVFKTYTNAGRISQISVHEKFELTDEAKAILGSDGKEVGVHGGIGFNLEPTTLQITKCEVSPKVSEDSKLSVSIKVDAPK